MIAAIDRGSCHVEFWNLAAENPERLATFDEVDPDGRGDSLTSLAFSPDGKTLACAGARTVRLLDVASRTVRRALNERLVLDLAFSPDGKHLATGRYDGVQFWNAETGERAGPRIEMTAVESLAFSPDSRQLATGDVEGNITLWNVADRTKTWSTRLGGRYRAYMPLSVPPIMLAVWLVTCVWFVWRRT
jgi:WD40 repeat protein